MTHLISSLYHDFVAQFMTDPESIQKIQTVIDEAKNNPVGQRCTPDILAAKKLRACASMLTFFAEQFEALDDELAEASGVRLVS